MSSLVLPIILCDFAHPCSHARLRKVEEPPSGQTVSGQRSRDSLKAVWRTGSNRNIAEIRRPHRFEAVGTRVGPAAQSTEVRKWEVGGSLETVLRMEG